MTDKRLIDATEEVLREYDKKQEAGSNGKT